MIDVILVAEAQFISFSFVQVRCSLETFIICRYFLSGASVLQKNEVFKKWDFLGWDYTNSRRKNLKVELMVEIIL